MTISQTSWSNLEGVVPIEGRSAIKKQINRVVTAANTDIAASTAAAVAAVVTALTPVFVADATPYTVLSANSGRTHFILEQTSTITLNLPVIAAGLYFKFTLGGVATEAQNWLIVATTPSFYNAGVVWLDSDAAGDNIAPVYGNGTSHLTLTAVTPEAGTVIEIYSNGTEWFVSGSISSATVPTFT